jgi:hypothetical protein
VTGRRDKKTRREWRQQQGRAGEGELVGLEFLVEKKEEKERQASSFSVKGYLGVGVAFC